jgi:Coenzyme PQQ synthesis protein D (PqqD)
MRAREDTHPLDPSHILRPVAGASFALLDDRPVLFSEAVQKIYELNQMAAYIWCSLLDRKPAEAICQDLTKFGLDRAAAQDCVRQALQNWLKLGLIEVDWKLDETHAFAARVGKLAVNIRTSSERLTQLLKPLFGQSSEANDSIEDTYEIVELDRQVHIFHNRACIARCESNELVPTLKAHITEQLTLKCSPDIALHAACLLSGGRGLLISGHPGAGKTTLAVHLMEAGFAYAADDIVLIGPDGRATGVLFAPALKQGAWTIIRKLRPDLGKSAVHSRPDGKRVRYLNAPRGNGNGNVPVGWIIFIKRAPNIRAKLAPLGQLETIRRLIDGSYAPDGKLSHQAFHAMKRTVADARSFELRYSDAAQARDAIVELCNG